MIRRTAALAAAVLAAAALAACAAKSPSLTGGTYTMAADGSSEEIFAPSVWFDTENNAFSFGYDPLSSYLSVGSITVSGSKVTANTDDGLYTYVFELVDDDTVRFLADESSKTTGANGTTAVPDGAEFRRTDSAEP